MTKEQILAMSTSRELDALVAQYVMGCRVFWHRVGCDPYPACACDPLVDGYGGRHHPHATPGCGDAVRRFSRSLVAAWAVVDHLLTRDSSTEIERIPGMVVVTITTIVDGDPLPHVAIEEADADTAPVAICRAALLAVRAFEAPTP